MKDGIIFIVITACVFLAVEIITAVFARKTNEEDDSEEAEYEAA